ncbi:MAG: family 10 glycosylhydrolase [Lachnospiraceae bacterium]|nr:family 10 glycosylhydrolase [Lachnospiraceae bacterium]
MRLMKKITALLLSAAISFCLAGAAFSTEAVAAPASMKATWLSFVDIQGLLRGKNQTGFDQSFQAICQAVAANGGNAIMVHVRSHNDAIYPSSIYPWSSMMLLGADPGFDPLSDMVGIAHSSGLQIHAWINPYGFRNGAYAGNAALATQANIVAGVQEILNRYAVDGIHFDDYFPPIGAANLNAMIAQVHQVCASSGKVFGISPQGNIQNNIAMGADVATWMSVPGYVDYIAPQIYWTDNYGAAGTTAMSTQRLQQWKGLNKLGIPMYVGMALYRSGSPNASDPGWTLQTNNLAKQAQTAASLGYSGYMLYSAKSVVAPNPSQQAELANLRSVWP